MALTRTYKTARMVGEGDKLFRDNYEGFAIVNRMESLVQLKHLGAEPNPFIHIDGTTDIGLMFTQPINEKLIDRMQGPKITIFAADERALEEVVRNLEKVTEAILVEV